MTNCSVCGTGLTAQEERYADIGGLLDWQECTSCKQREVITAPEGTRYRCALCKRLFPHAEIFYLRGDVGYTKLCSPCWDKPEAQAFLPYMKRLALGLVSPDEIRNWNAFHDM